jgi:hypothetical protein
MVVSGVFLWLLDFYLYWYHFVGGGKKKYIKLAKLQSLLVTPGED